MGTVGELETGFSSSEGGTSNSRVLLITGSTIGNALAHALAEDENVSRIWLSWRSSAPEITSEKIKCFQMDACVESEVASALDRLGPLDGSINTIGLLHDGSVKPEKSISRLDTAGFDKTLTVNVLPTLLLAKYGRKALRDSQQAWFATLSARVGSISDNQLGGWYSYRASKAALNMALKSLAIEWRIALPRCTVASLHPGTVGSPLSAPFTRRTEPERVFTPAQSASYLKEVLHKLSPVQSGRFWSWDGTEIPW